MVKNTLWSQVAVVRMTVVRITGVTIGTVFTVIRGNFCRSVLTIIIVVVVVVIVVVILTTAIMLRIQ